MLEKCLQALKEKTGGEVRYDPLSKKIYSVDASLFEIEPKAIYIPTTQEDLHQAVSIIASYNIPMIPRGAATGTTGGCLGDGIIIDTSQYLNKIIQVNEKEKWVICEPGVVQDDLNTFLRPYGFRLGPDTSTGNRATLGGMLANNAAGAHSLVFGSMRDHILSVDLILSSGKKITLSTTYTSTDDEPFKTLDHIRTQHADLISKHFPPLPRRSSGYALDALSQPCRLIAGSEGSLGIISQMKLRIASLLPQTNMSLLPFTSLQEALETIPSLLETQPYALELIDHTILEQGKKSPVHRHKLHWLTGNPTHLLAIEHTELAPAHSLTLTPSQTQEVWDLRKAGLELLLSKRSYTRAIAFIEDLALPPDQLAPFMREFLPRLQKLGPNAGIYGHAGAGCLHIRPYLDPRYLSEIPSFMEKTTDLIKQYKGSLSGEHGDGKIRSWLNKRLYGTSIYELFTSIKTAFDPLNLMNPGAIVAPSHFPKDVLRSTPTKEPKTFLDFSQEGGLALAADMCNGNALCRKKTGTMCPSFQATNDEFDTTRARANALRHVINGNYSLSDPSLSDVLDLCLECKGCLRECPSQVDMAKMKAEVLYQTGRFSLRSRLFAHVPQLYALGLPRLFNALSSLFGIFTKHKPPRLSSKTFSKLSPPSPHSKNKVVLFNDTYTQYLYPEIGLAAQKVLEAMGFEVIVPAWKCCGRTLYSKGFLPQAKQKAQELIDQLAKYPHPILSLEPSCTSMLQHDFSSLSEEVNERVVSFDAFVLENYDRLPQLQGKGEFVVHTHCHAKAHDEKNFTVELLEKIPQIRIHPLNNGCCGMAGSFGYEKEHYDISQKIGQIAFQDLPEGIIIANGVSCRTQIAHTFERETMHIAECLFSLMEPQSTRRAQRG